VLDLRPGSKVYGGGVSTYTIGEAAERSGFSASALRYYEGIGLVEPATRTAAGYRLYDDGTLARLAFITRAKQLGCSLEEITDLVGVWDGERCGPVQRRFHDLVTEKLSDAQRQIAELTALTDQLRQAAALLDGPATDGPCSEACACSALGAAAAGLRLTSKSAGR
jgi:DNA-binding transcriptional MerR regulator